MRQSKADAKAEAEKTRLEAKAEAEKARLEAEKASLKATADADRRILDFITSSGYKGLRDLVEKEKERLREGVKN